jgi:anti-sigma regulatory factor (Ser/Thr protein kinase)
MPYYRCPACGLTVHSAAVYAAARTCPDCSAALPDDSKLYPAPGARRSVRRVLAAQPEAVGKARRAVVGLPVNQATRDTLSLLVSELVTNAIRHGGAQGASDAVTVHAALRDSALRLEVTDPGPGFEPGGHGPRPDGGYGLHLLDRLATRWGVSGGDPVTVWVELDR